MKIVISTDGDFVSPHFGRCPEFTIIDIENNRIVKREKINNPGHQPGFLPQFFHQKGVNVIICGGMGERAKSMFNDLGIKTIVGISGKIDEVIGKLEKGILEVGENLCEGGD